MPRNRQGIFRLLKLWFAIMSCQLLLWVVLMKTLYLDGEQVTNWDSKEVSGEDTPRTLLGPSPLWQRAPGVAACCYLRIHADVRSIDDVFNLFSRVAIVRLQIVFTCRLRFCQSHFTRAF